MNIKGYGGRGGNDHTDYMALLKGLIGVEGKELLPLKNCANPKCGRPFRPRAEGDDYCNERCDPLNKFRGSEVSNSD